MKHKEMRLLALVLALVCALSAATSAVDLYASNYLEKYEIDAVSTGGGNVAIFLSVYGTGRMSRLGAEKIYVYEKVNGRWMIADYFDSSDSGMVGTNTNALVSTIYFSGYSNTEYKIGATIFAEDSTGSDSRYLEVLINT